MRIAYNPKTAQALMSAPNNEDITFDLSGLAIYVKGVKFEGKAYSVFKKHTLNTTGGYDGLVPAPSYTETTERYLREDGTWVVPNNTTANLANYVTLNGDLTISGVKIFSAGDIPIKLNSTDNEVGIQFLLNYAAKGWVGYTKTTGTYLYNYPSNTCVGVKDDGTPYYYSEGFKTLLHSGNYTDYTVKKDGTGASGTWGINISGNASNADTVGNLHASAFVRNYGIIGANNGGGSWLGYTYSTEEHGGATSGGVITAGVNTNYIQLNGSVDRYALYYRYCDDGVVNDWKQIAFVDSDITGNAASADKVNNSLTLKINSGTTEGTDLYTYDGSSAKTLNIQRGKGIGFTNTEGVLSIHNAGVRAIATGTTNGTISVNTNGTTADVAVKGLDTAAYINKKLLANYTKGNNYIAFNLYDSSLHSVGSGKGYIEYYDNDAWYNSRWGWVEAIDGFKGSLTGNASSATKLQTPRTIWGLNFDGSESVKGIMREVSTIHFGNQPYGARGIYQGHWYAENLTEEDIALNFARTYFAGNVGIGTTSPSQKLEVNGNVKATSFIGNLDGTYINKLTGYTKATEIAALAATDSLNTALGKLEYKADTAYNLVKGAYDGDGTIENLAEILKVLDGIKDTDTIQAIVGKYLPLTGGTLTGSLSVQDASVNVRSDKALLRFLSAEDITYIESGNRAFNDNAPLKITGYNGFTGSDLYLQFNRIYCRGGNYTNLDSGNTYINNGTITINGNNITPLTSHQSLANYVTLNTALTITGTKTFNLFIQFKPGTTGGFAFGISNIDSAGDKNNKRTAGIGFLNRDGIFSGAYIGWGESPWNSLNNLYVNDTTFTYKNYKIWHAGNDGAGSGLDADLLDGLHSDDFFKKLGTNEDINTYADNSNKNGILYINTTTPENINAPFRYGSILSLNVDAGSWMIACLSNGTLLYRSRWWSASGNNWGDWNTFIHEGNYTSYLPFLNSTSTHATNTSKIYAPSTGGTANQVLISNGNAAPTWTNQSNIAAGSSQVLLTDAKRPADANYLEKKGDGGIRQFKSSSSMTTNKPDFDGTILHFSWDTKGGWDSQLCIANGGYDLTRNQYIQWRGLNEGVWGEWKTIASLNDIPTKLSQLTNDSGFLTSRGYIGTTAVQASSTALALTGITNLTMNGTYTNNNKLVINSSGYIYPYSTSTRTAGMYGNYDSTKVGHVWSMGTNYKIADDGSSTNNMYGLVYFHTNWSNDKTRNTATRDGSLITEVSAYAVGHQIAFVSNGKVTASLGDWIWARAGFLKSGSSDSYILLGGGGHKKLSDFLLKSEELTNNLTTITKTLVVSKDWVDTGIVFNKDTFHDGTGSYIVQLSRDDLYYWTGCLSIVISNNVTKVDSDEIILHGGGFDSSFHYYLRTVHDTTNKVVKLQIARSSTDNRSLPFTFKFKKLI